VDYDATDIPAVYDLGRDHGPAFLDLWMRTVAAHVRAPRTILDLGCGTGRFSNALAAHFDADVIGVDPSAKMLEQARRKPVDRRVRYQSGRGEAIPLRRAHTHGMMHRLLWSSIGTARPTTDHVTPPDSRDLSYTSGTSGTSR
jgi:SAM-dependent methyltransferase